MVAKRLKGPRAHGIPERAALGLRLLSESDTPMNPLLAATHRTYNGDMKVVVVDYEPFGMSMTNHTLFLRASAGLVFTGSTLSRFAPRVALWCARMLLYWRSNMSVKIAMWWGGHYAMIREREK
jgi:hypothetical protein